MYSIQCKHRCLYRNGCYGLEVFAFALVYVSFVDFSNNVNEVSWEWLLSAPNNRPYNPGARLSLYRQLGKTRLGEAGLFSHNRQSEPCMAVYLSCHVFFLSFSVSGPLDGLSLLFKLVFLPVGWLTCLKFLSHQPVLVLQ